MKSKTRRPIVFPLSSYNSLLLSSSFGAGNPIHSRLILTFLSHLVEQEEGKLIELGACDCYSLYSLIEEVYFTNSEDNLPSISQEERYELYGRLHNRMLEDKTYLRFYNSLCNVYSAVLRKYEKITSLDAFLSENFPFSSLLLLSFRFKDELHRELVSEVRGMNFFNDIYQSCSQDEYYKFIHFLFCGVPVYNYLLSPFQVNTINPCDLCFLTAENVKTTIVYFSHIPIYFGSE